MAQQPQHGDGSFNLLYKIADNTYDISQGGGGSGGIGATGATGATGVTPANIILSDTTGLTGATQLANIVQITQAGYNLIATPNVNTLYIIVG